jgi:23S rRNA pseudouridine2605 synthase
LNFQEILARAVFGSRRACEELIAAGRVRINGQVAILGDKADSQRDKILLDSKQVQVTEPLVYIALHKPRGVLSAGVGRLMVDTLPQRWVDP